MTNVFQGALLLFFNFPVLLLLLVKPMQRQVVVNSVAKAYFVPRSTKIFISFGFTKFQTSLQNFPSHAFDCIFEYSLFLYANTVSLSLASYDLKYFRCLENNKTAVLTPV
jgi:hypothetical protein